MKREIFLVLLCMLVRLLYHSISEAINKTFHRIWYHFTQDKESWFEKDCRVCQCRNGTVKCERQRCKSANSLKCPAVSKHRKLHNTIKILISFFHVVITVMTSYWKPEYVKQILWSTLKIKVCHMQQKWNEYNIKYQGIGEKYFSIMNSILHMKIWYEKRHKHNDDYLF